MKRFLSGHATHPQWAMAAALVVAQLQAQTRLPGYALAPSLGLVYITEAYAPDVDALLQYLAQALPKVQGWCGTVGAGVLAMPAEYAEEPALSVMLCDVDPAHWRVYSGLAPLQARGADGWAPHHALVHGDAAMPDLVELVHELAERTSARWLFGGFSSSRSEAVQIASSQGGLSVDVARSIFCGGLSGVAFSAAVPCVTRITQGCVPVGRTHRITACDGNLVLALDGEPALGVLLKTLDVSLEGDPQPALQRVRATLAGLRNDDGAAPSTPERMGELPQGLRLRQILGLDGSRQGVALSEEVTPGMALVFCQRSVAAARADLMRVCAEIREELSPQPDAWGQGMDVAPEAEERPILGAVYVSCVARGGDYFGAASAEMQLLRHALGDVPLTGFLAAGEIAGQQLHGFTGVLTVFTAA